MPQLLLRRLLHPIAALVGTLLLHACSQPMPETAADASPQGPTPAAAATLRTTGTAADSLNGIPGHAFGDPLRNFPGLVLAQKADETGVRWYRMPAGQERGWLGQYADYSIISYQFQDGRFSMFRAVTSGLKGNPTALRDEAIALFGPGNDQHDRMGGLDWNGERVRAMYSEKRTPPVTCWLEVHSKPVIAVQQAKEEAKLLAQMQAEEAANQL